MLSEDGIMALITNYNRLFTIESVTTIHSAEKEMPNFAERSFFSMPVLRSIITEFTERKNESEKPNIIRGFDENFLNRDCSGGIVVKGIRQPIL